MSAPHADAVWIAVHVHRHEGLDDVLVHTVRPLVRDLRTEGDLIGWFFLRYWNGGTHLRLRLLVPAGSERRVRAVVAERVGDRLRRVPSREALTQERYEALAREFADWERTAVLPLVPDDSVVFAGYEPEHHRYGTGSALRAVERHFTESSVLALRVLASAPTRGQRLSLALSAVAAARAQHPDGLAPGSDLLRPMFPRPLSAHLRADLDAEYAHRRETLVRAVQRCRTRAGETSEPDPSTVREAWWRTTSQLRHVLSRPRDDGSEAVPPARIGLLLDACAHLFCNRLGLSAADELYVRHLIGRATDDLPAASDPETTKR
ncbi:thiopeptide-type bacteriocin biosynthesis protein [Streptomyces sp. NPDC055607]